MQACQTLSCVNLTNAGTWRQPVHELIPIGPFMAMVKAPADVRGWRARLRVSGKTIAANRTAGQCRFASDGKRANASVPGCNELK